MQIKTLDGYSLRWSLTGHHAHAKLINKSSFHISARKVIRNIYPTLQVLEEVPVPIKKSETYYFDFYLPMIKTVIEVHGEQHYQFSKFYHINMFGFAKAKKRDRDKIEWCNINNIKYIELPYNETENQWIERMYHA